MPKWDRKDQALRKLCLTNLLRLGIAMKAIHWRALPQSNKGLVLNYGHSSWSSWDHTKRSMEIPKARILVRRLPRVMPRIFAACN